MLTLINQFLSFTLLFPALTFLGIYLTFKLRFLQISQFRTGFKHLFCKEKGGQGNISRYQAVASILAGNLGTGNISGMGVALVTGGPGALVWMWIWAFFGSIIQYASCLLAVKHRKKNEKGEYVGGPMYYLKEGMGLQWVAKFFAFFVVMGAISVGIFCQINSMSLSFENLGIPAGVTGVVIAAFVALVLFGGVQRVAKVAAAIIPFVAILYLGGALFILSLFWREILPAFVLMFKSALGMSSFTGGALGFGMMQVITSGIGRALFATDVGTGYVPILQAQAKSHHHVIDGIVALVAPFFVMVVCTITSLVLIVTKADLALKSTAIVVNAFQLGIGQAMGSFVVNTALLLFGYTTILAWGFCFERAVTFLVGSRFIKMFRLFFIFLIPISAFCSVDFVWVFADISLALMTLTNLIGIFGLSKEVVLESRSYLLSEKI